MKIRCIADRATPEQVERLDMQIAPDYSFNLTPGKEYLVIALTALSGASFYGSGVVVDVVDDFGRWSMAPLLLFELTDSRPSRHWLAKKVGDAELALWPESFFAKSYHDRLTEGVEQVVADFQRVYLLLEAEYSGVVDRISGSSEEWNEA